MQRVGFAYDAEALRLAPPAHLTVELAVLAHLYPEEDTAAAIHEFLHEHVLPWAPTYCAEVATAATLSLYCMAAQLVSALLADEVPARA